MRTQSWIAVITPGTVETLARDGWRRLPLDPAVAPRPRSGDRVALLAVRGPRFVESAAFVGMAEADVGHGDGLTLRGRVVAPPGHAVGLSELPSLRVAAGWTHTILGGLVGTTVRCGARDLDRAASALLARARAFGPPARRPTHRRARTPGRRHLLAGRIAARGRP